MYDFRMEFVTSSPPGTFKSNVSQVGTNSALGLETLQAGVSWYYVNIIWNTTSTKTSENIFCFSAVGSTG